MLKRKILLKIFLLEQDYLLWSNSKGKYFNILNFYFLFSFPTEPFFSHTSTNFDKPFLHPDSTKRFQISPKKSPVSFYLEKIMPHHRPYFIIPDQFRDCVLTKRIKKGGKKGILNRFFL